MKKVWYIFSEDHHLGPFEVREIAQKLKDGGVSRKALLWKEGMKDWVILEKIPDFHSLFNERDDHSSLTERSRPPAVPSLPDLPENPPIAEEEIAVNNSSEKNRDDFLPPDIPDLPKIPDPSTSSGL